MRWNHKTLTISFFIQFPQVTAVEERPVTETLAQVEASGFLDRITRRSVVNADGNKAWKSAAASRGLPFQNVIHQVKNFTSDCPKVWPEVSTVAGTQTLDRSWRSLKTFLPKGTTVKQKIQGHSCMHPSVPQYMYMWAWRQSLGNVSPNEFLEHLEDLLPQDWCYKIKKKEANPCKDQLVTSFPKTLKIIVSLRRKHHFANFPMEFSHKKGIHPRFDKSSQNAVKINVRSYSILILTHGRLCAGFLVSLNMFQFIQNKESFEGSSSQPWIN